jgi:ABC-type sugar transport system ATPase subunit
MNTVNNVAERPTVAVRGLSKSFTGTPALDAVELVVMPGEIHALVGGNGSGKSTLIKILCGVYEADAGEAQFGDQVLDVSKLSPELARVNRVHVVHQDLGIFPDLSVAENIALGSRYATDRIGRVRWRELRRLTESLIERFEIDAQPDTLIRTLSQGTRTQVAIARALQEGSEEDALLILDEPTASLPAHEVNLLLATLRRYAARGQAILYVSHRLDEVLDIADRVTVLRDGHGIGTFGMDGMTEERLIELILGRQLENAFPEIEHTREGSDMLRIRNLVAGPLRGVDLSIARGEVVGIAGLLGSGRSELARAIFGDLPIVDGTMELDGESFRPRRPRDAIRAGVALVPENRLADASFPDLSIATNISMASLTDYWRKGRIHQRRLRRDAGRIMDRFLVRAAGDGAPLSTLSGGNQQKVILARWLRREPKLLLLDEPTQGVDVGARSEIYEFVREAVSGGASALVIASDYEELAAVSDRVLVLRNGRIFAEVAGKELSAHRLTQITYQGIGV